MLMSKIKLTFAAAALCGGLLTLAPISGALAVPIAPIDKAAKAIDSPSMVHYRDYYHRHGYWRRHHWRHHHCWWRYGHRHCRW
jgi:hypothetical protein